MFTLKFKTEPTLLEMEIDRLLLELEKIDEKNSEKYSEIVSQIVSLYKLKEIDNNSKKYVSADKMAEIIGSLIGVLAIINYERLHVITTKAMAHVIKIK